MLRGSSRAQQATPAPTSLSLSHEVRATEQWLRDSVRDDHRVEFVAHSSRVGRSARHRGGPGNRPHRTLRLCGQAGGLRWSGPHYLVFGRSDLPRQADAADQQVVALGTGESGLGGSPTGPLLPHALRYPPRAPTCANRDRRHRPLAARGGVAHTERRPPVPEPATRRFATDVKDFLGCPRHSIAVWGSLAG